MVIWEVTKFTVVAIIGFVSAPVTGPIPVAVGGVALLKVVALKAAAFVVIP